MTEYRLMLSSIANDGPSFLFMTDVHSDRNYVVKWTFQLQQSPVLVPVKHIPASEDLFLQQYVHLNADYAVAVYLHNVCDVFELSAS